MDTQLMELVKQTLDGRHTIKEKMSRKVWTRRMSFNLSRKIIWRMAAPLTFSLFFGWGIQMSLAADSQFAPAPSRGQSRITAQRIFEEGSALHDQGTAESLRMAVEKYEEALSLWRIIG